MAGAWPQLPNLPPIGPTAEKPKPGVRLLIPAAAAAILLVSLVVPWHVRGDSLITVAGILSDQGARDFGDLYALYVVMPLAVVAALVGFAGASDLKALRWTQLGAAVLLFGAVGVVGMDVSVELQPYLFIVVGVAVVGSVVVACLKRLPLRIVAGAYLAGCALMHGAVLVTWHAPWLAGTAYLPALGFLVGATGAVIGPRYVPEFPQL